MLAIENYDWLIRIFLILFTIVPVMSIIGKIFTKHGRESIAANPLMFLYFIIYFTFAYFFWFKPQLIVDYIGIAPIYQNLIYGAMSLVPFFERDIVN